MQRDRVTAGNQQASTIVVVDDDPFVLEAVTILLKEHGYTVIPCHNGQGALEELACREVNVALTDIKMPGMSGVELLGRIHQLYPDLPVILMTAFAELGMAIDAVKEGAFDFIIKPSRYEQLMSAIEKAIKYDGLIRREREYKKTLEDTVSQRTRELSNALEMVRSMSYEIIKRLTSAAEYRDTDTGTHILRIGLYAERIAKDLAMDSVFTNTIKVASQLHDVGKIGIPDSILLKPGGLTVEEFAVMKTHTTIGASILSGSDYPLLQMAQSIALNHHERWDGSGYPAGLAGGNIPLEARIVIICDQYDALISRRPYKSSIEHEKVVEIITKGDGRTNPCHFDPTVLESFIRVSSNLEEIFNSRHE